MDHTKIIETIRKAARRIADGETLDTPDGATITHDGETTEIKLTSLAGTSVIIYGRHTRWNTLTANGMWQIEKTAPAEETLARIIQSIIY